MAAHIVHDLPLALKKVGLRDGDQSHIDDFHLANDVLERGIDQIQNAIGKRYNSYLMWLDGLGTRVDEVLTNYGIRLARATAWFNGERLVNSRTAKKAQASIEESAKEIVKWLLCPPLLSLRLFFRLIRKMSRLTRTWPVRRIV